MIRTAATKTTAALALYMLLQAAALAAPTQLTDTQLDQISAGVSATVSADAQAAGAYTLAKTDVATKSHEGRFVSIAWGRGRAVAKGTDAAQTSVDVDGEGRVLHTGSHTVSYKTPKGIVSRSWGFVFAVEVNRDAFRAVGAALR